MTSQQHSLSLCRLSVRHWISIRMASMPISADCSLHRVLKQHWKVISSLRTWPGLLLLPTCDPPWGTALWERGNVGVKLKEREHNSPRVHGRGGERNGGVGSEAWWHFAARRSGASLTVWNLPLRCQTPGAALSLSRVYQASWRAPSCTVCTHTLLHNYQSIDKKAILSQQIAYIVDTSGLSVSRQLREAALGWLSPEINHLIDPNKLKNILWLRRFNRKQ